MHSILIGILALTLCGCASQQQLEADKYSGFLTNYGSLKKAETPSGSDVWRWVSPELKRHTYKAIYFEPFNFFPVPDAQDQVSKEALVKIKNRIEARAHTVAAKLNIPVAQEKGPDVLVVRSALTSLSVKLEDFKVRELIPVRLVISGTQLALGARDKNVSFLIETELNDGATGKPLAMSVRKIKAEPLENDTQQLTTAHVKTVIEQLQQDLKTDFTQLKSLMEARKR